MSRRTYEAPSHLMPFYLAWQLDPCDSNYNLCFSYRFKNSQAVDLLLEKLQELVRSKAYLRQTFFLEGDKLVATIHEDFPPEVNYYSTNLSDFPKLELELIKKPHDLKSRSPVHVNIIQFKDGCDYIVLISIHHIVMDGSTLDRFIGDLNRLLAGKKIEKEGIDDYLTQIDHEVPLEADNESNLLTNYYSELEKIARDSDYPARNNQDILHYSATLPMVLTKKLDFLSQRQCISKFNLLLLAYGIFLIKLFNKNNVLINYPVNIRTNKNINGCFLNIVTFPLSITHEDSYTSLIESFKNRFPTFKKIAKIKSDKNIYLEGTPNFSPLTVAQLEDLIIEGIEYTAKSYPQIANANISFKYREQQGKLHFICDVIMTLFPEYISASILSRFFNYLHKLLDSPASILATIDLTFAEEKQKILQHFNNTIAYFPQDKTLVDLFEEIVIKYPDKIAVQAFNGTISYSELNNKAEALANYLIDKNIKPNDLVGILIDNRLEMIIALIAVLKSGAAYVPIAYDLPPNRITFIIEDSKIKFILTIPEFVKHISTNIEIIDLQSYRGDSTKYKKPSIKPNDLAYAIYTSGTTGHPKGVLIEHQSVVNYVCFLIHENKLSCNSIGSKYAGFGFDASVTEIYPILLVGGALCIIKDENKVDCLKTNDFFIQYKVNYAFLPTQFAENFFHIKNKTLSTLIVGGEKLNRFIPQFYSVINAYGPTETTVQPTNFVVSHLEKNIPIGKPIWNVKCYVVDSNLNLLPIGIVGELCIAGVNLARGYLNNSELMEQKFIKNPFVNAQDNKKFYSRLYKTGDLARWLPNGNLEYLGRKDNQVKIRGYRIELEEIENILSSFQGITQNAVLIKEYEEQKFIIAYYTSDVKLDEKDILEYLAKHLPKYMLPMRIIRIKKFPLSANGKLNTQALPFPKFTSINSYVPPRSEQEKIICAAFMRILKINKVGINDSFFKLGGNSIKAITLVSELQNTFEIQVADIFNFKTPKKISKNVNWTKKTLLSRLHHIKHEEQNYLHQNSMSKKLKDKLIQYWETINDVPKKYHEKPISTILLTGSTGYLGCNVLNHLLNLTNYHVFLLIRAKSNEEAFMRIDKKFQFYFGKSLSNIRHRISVLSADIEKSYFGLTSEKYKLLAQKIDSIIHAAALVKHYGNYKQFYSSNVQATIHLLELAKLTKMKDFHYISTISVLMNSTNYLDHNYFFTEDDSGNADDNQKNPYIQTKLEGEKKVLEFRKQGVNSSIYRVGNLAFIAKDGRIQENEEDNAFLNQLKCLIKLEMITPAISTVEISPVDLTAKALVLLFDKIELQNHTYHVFNPNLCNLAELLPQSSDISIKNLSMPVFIDTLAQHLGNPEYQPWIERFILHQGWLDEKVIYKPLIYILQDRTQHILTGLNFKWPPITIKLFSRYLKNFKNEKMGIVR